MVAERTGTIILSAIVAHTAWHWTSERFDVLRQFPWPTVTAADLASGLSWLIVIVAIAAMKASRRSLGRKTSGRFIS